MLEVQKFLMDNSVEELIKQFGIKVREYPENNLIVLNYCQIESPKTHPISIECRGLILDSKTYKVVSRSFDRFFNFGEGGTQDFDFSTAFAYQKVDGSLIKVYWCDNTNQWEISTRGTAFAELENPTGKTFRELVLRAFGMTERVFQVWALLEFFKSHTYLFEYCSPMNRVVTPYDKDYMFVLGARSNREDDNYLVDSSDSIHSFLVHSGANIHPLNEYKLTDHKHVMEILDSMGSMEEGVVCRDANGGMVKIKKESYVAIHRMRGNGTPSLNNVGLLIVTNEHDEYLTYFECDRPMFTPLIDGWESLKTKIDGVFDSIKDIEIQKDFALKVMELDKENSGVYFEMRKSYLANQKYDAGHIMSMNNVRAVKSLLAYIGE